MRKLQRRIARGEFIADFRTRRPCRDGTMLDVHLSAGPIFDSTGAIVGSAFLLHDVSEEVRTAELERRRYEVLELAAKDAPLQEILDRLVDGIELAVANSVAAIHLDVGGELKLASSVTSIDPQSVTAFASAGWSVPIRKGHNVTVGRIAVFPSELREPTSHELRFMHEAGHLAAIAIEGNNARMRLERMALRDPLTRLPNRMLFEDRLRGAIALARRNNTKLALGLLDLNRFKVVNDTLGHAVGDQLLVQVARRLNSAVREGDTLARMGGDEFLLLINDVQDRDTAGTVAERFLSGLDRSFAVGGYEIFVQASMGIALFPDDTTDSGQLLRLADNAMYRAKGAAAKFLFHEEGEQKHSTTRMALESFLNRSLENNELELFYQPKVSLSTREVRGVEALVRWRHPQLGLTMPNDFVPLAEETGLIVPIGKWVLSEACRFGARWRAAGADGYVCVNVSARQFESDDFIETVVEALDESGLDPSALRLEITESLIMRSPDAAAATLSHLRSLGVRSMIDDFGTGYSSLNSLKRFPIDALKIDRSFVAEITAEGTSPNDEAIVRAIIGMAKALGLDVIAEGVETEAQAAFLLEHDCDLAQGYLFSKPIPDAEMMRWRSSGLPPV
jgi:diguanylate cyclase (GGDEF)-like protein